MAYLAHSKTKWMWKLIFPLKQWLKHYKNINVTMPKQIGSSGNLHSIVYTRTCDVIATPMCNCVCTWRSRRVVCGRSMAILHVSDRSVLYTWIWIWIRHYWRLPWWPIWMSSLMRRLSGDILLNLVNRFEKWFLFYEASSVIFWDGKCFEEIWIKLSLWWSLWVGARDVLYSVAP